MDIQKYKLLLTKLISFKSISTDPIYKPEIDALVAHLSGMFSEKGFKVEVVTGYDNPIVVARYETDPTLKTVLIYGHYDVQPADISDGWTNDPFTLSEQNNRLVARGIVDNKGQVMIHISTVFDLIEKDNLGYNVVFMIEGNEETGSPNISKFMYEKKDLLKSDFALISDGEITSELPTLETGFRGGFNTTVTVTTSTTDLHSGLYGGAVPSASSVLTNILEKLMDGTGKVLMPGFYKDVDPVPTDILANNASIPFSEEDYKYLSGTNKMTCVNNVDFFTQTGLYPAVIVTGLQSGYTGVGYRNSVPATAVAKINFRLVKSQNPQAIAEQFKTYITSIAPDYVDVKVEITDPYDGIKLDLNNEYIEKAKRAVKLTFGVDPIYKFCGGGLPITTLINDIFGIPQVLMPLANEDCRTHAVGENYTIGLINKALAFSEEFLKKQ